MWPITQNNPDTLDRDIQTKLKRDIIAGALKQGTKLGTNETATPNCKPPINNLPQHHQKALSQRSSEGKNHDPALWLHQEDNTIQSIALHHAWREWNSSSKYCWENAWKQRTSRHPFSQKLKQGHCWFSKIKDIPLSNTLPNFEGLNSDYSVSARRKLMQKSSLKYVHNVKLSSAQRPVAESMQPTDRIPCPSLREGHHYLSRARLEEDEKN